MFSLIFISLFLHEYCNQKKNLVLPSAVSPQQSLSQFQAEAVDHVVLLHWQDVAGLVVMVSGEQDET